MGFFFVCKDFFLLFSKLLRLLLKITEVSTEHKKWPKISTNSGKSSLFLPKGEKSLGGRIKLSAGARRKPAYRAIPSSAANSSMPAEPLSGIAGKTLYWGKAGDLTRDTWHMTRFGGWTFSQNFIAVCDLWYYEDLEGKDDSINQWNTRLFVGQPRLHRVCQISVFATRWSWYVAFFHPCSHLLI